MRIFNDSETIAERVFENGDFDSVADAGYFGNRFRAEFLQFSINRLNVADAPISDGVVAFYNIFAVRVESQFKSADVETHVKRFIEIRRETENRRIPIFRRSQVVNLINNRSQSSNQFFQTPISCCFNSSNCVLTEPS